MKTLLSLLVLSAFYMGSANATIFLQSHGDSTGVQSYTYTFGNSYSGLLTIGSSNQGDSALTPSLYLSDFGGLLAGTSDTTLTGTSTNTSAFQNTLGENGTYGSTFTSSIIANIGDMITFSWNFVTTDYVPFNDFAFADISNVNYNVLAEISTNTNPVPTPATLALLALGLGLIGFGKRKKA